MARIKPQTLLLQSKKKKGPSHVSILTMIVYCLLVGVLILLLVATYRQWSNEPHGMDLSNFEGVDVTLDSKKYHLPGYAILNTAKGYITVELLKDVAPEIVDKFLDLCPKHEAFMLGTNKSKQDDKKFGFFITTAPIPDLNNRFIAFGRVVKEQDVVQEIDEDDIDERYQQKSPVGIIIVTLLREI